jgi:hypothetical protein
LSDKLGSVELSNNGLEDFVHNGRKNTLVIVLAKGTVNSGELVNAGLGKHTASNVDHLEIWYSARRVH